MLSEDGGFLAGVEEFNSRFSFLILYEGVERIVLTVLRSGHYNEDNQNQVSLHKDLALSFYHDSMHRRSVSRNLPSYGHNPPVVD